MPAWIILCLSPISLVGSPLTSARITFETVAQLSRNANPVARFKRGSQSLFNISVYSFGMSGVWIGYGSILLQFKVTEIAALNPVLVLGWALDKTSVTALISLIGLAIAAVVQPASGLISDRYIKNAALQRYPFIIFGLLGLAASTVMFGFVSGFVTLLLVTIAMQIFGNTAQGPANALIIDHVEDSDRGRASGVLNLMRLAGSGFVAMIVIFLMSNYHVDDAPQWMWYSVVVMVAVLVGTTTYTLLALRSPTARQVEEAIRSNDLVSDPDEDSGHDRRTRYYLVLVAMGFIIAALSATQTNAIFFVQDVIGLENPAQGGNYILAGLVGTAAVVVYPAGKLSDRIGRGLLLLSSGIIGACGVLSMLLLNANSLIEVIPGVMAIGFAVGIYLSVGWAVANDLVKRSTAARDLGLTSISGLLGAIVGRSSGFFIGGLNERGLDAGIEFLGYGVVLGMTSFAFLLSGITFWLVVRNE